MEGEFESNRDFLKSLTAAVLMFALTFVGMAEMTGYQTSIFGVLIGGATATVSNQASQTAQQQASQSAQQQVTQVAQATITGANQTIEASTGASSSVPQEGSSTTTGPGTTIPGVAIDTSQDPVITGTQGGRGGGTTGGNSTIEISARVVNAQLSYQLASASAAPVPESIGDLGFSRNSDTKFTVVANGVPGVAYVLEATFDFQQWQALARNYPSSSRVEFEVNRASEIHNGFLRVRALTPASAEVLSTGGLAATPTEIETGANEPVVTGVQGAGTGW